MRGVGMAQRSRPGEGKTKQGADGVGKAAACKDGDEMRWNGEEMKPNGRNETAERSKDLLSDGIAQQGFA